MNGQENVQVVGQDITDHDAQALSRTLADINLQVTLLLYWEYVSELKFNMLLLCY